ncbi:MAG: HEAT repeat domain-containing protein [Thermodesulfobacteriota bacterium]
MDVTCLVLLGEPGIGKSSDLGTHFEVCRARCRDQGDDAQWVDLRSFGDENRLISKLFETPAFRGWRKGRHRLTLFLDSFDECPLRLSHLTALVIDEFKCRDLPFKRLCLRIACSTAVWPPLLEEAFGKFWGKDKVEVYSMAPLTPSAVSIAATANGLNSEAFLSEIRAREATLFAIKPVTLNLLIKLIKGPGQFPSTKYDLYERGMSKLCEDPSESRLSAQRSGQLDAKQRLAVAERIAAATVLCGRTSIWMRGDEGELRETDVPLWELRGLCSLETGGSLEVTEAVLRETLDTGLFTERGPNRLGWAHQTYGEFLAARFLEKHDFSLYQVKPLLFDGSETELRLFPQLSSVAGWLASRRSDIFDEVVKSDPDVLIAIDLSTLGESRKEALVESLLRALEQETLQVPSWSDEAFYPKLAHPRLAVQLRSYIRNRKNSFVVRREAITIAICCDVKDLVQDLLELAFDPIEDIGVREVAASALLDLGDESTKQSLKPFAVAVNDDDVNDGLKGIALQALWPNHISAAEVLGALTAPKRENPLGSYAMFLSHCFAKHLTSTDFPVALGWVRDQPPRESVPNRFQDLMDFVMIMAWNHLDNPKALECFCECILRRLDLDGGFFQHASDTEAWNRAVADDRKRREVLDRILPHLPRPEEDAVRLTDPQTPMVLPADLQWLIDKLAAPATKEMEKALIELIRHTFQRNDPEHVEAVLTAIQHNQALANVFAWLWRPIELDSEQAQRLRTDYDTATARNELRKEYKAQKEEQGVKILLLLERCELGTHTAFVDLTVHMMRRPDGMIMAGSNLKAVHGWKQADQPTRERLVNAAKNYVLDHVPDPATCFDTRKHHVQDKAGLVALRLLRSDAPGFLQTLSPEIWKRWAPLVLSAPTPSERGAGAAHVELASLAYRFAPAEFIEALIALIDRENRQSGNIYSLWIIAFRWDDRMTKALASKLDDNSLTIDSLASLLEELLAREVPEAELFAQSLVSHAISLPDEAKVKALEAACLLTAFRKAAAWPVIWPIIQQDPEFGRKLMLRVAWEDGGRGRQSLLRALTEEQLMALFLWLARVFPFEEDPQEEGGHTVSFREHVADWRDSIPGHLRDRGTQAAVEALERLIVELPNLHWLKPTLLQAKEQHRRRAWVPPTPSELFRTAERNLERRKAKERGRLIGIEEIDQFSMVSSIGRGIITEQILSAVRDLDEKSEFEPCIREIICDPTQTPHGPTEIADIITTHVSIAGQKELAAFVLKGKSFRNVSDRDVSHQIDKLANYMKSLDLAVLAAVGNIQDSAKVNFINRAHKEGWDWLIIDASDLARLLIAYNKICRCCGKPLEKDSPQCKHCDGKNKQNE